MRIVGCSFPECRSVGHSSYDTHILCACGWVGIAHTRHVAGITAVRKGRSTPRRRDAERAHRVVARQRLRRAA